MKRILLTTTSLVLAAGVAQADVSFSGTAGVALIDDNGARDVATAATAATTDDTSYGSDMFFESYYDFDVTASAESDNGVSVSLGFDIGGGSKIDYNDDDKVEAQGATATDADVTIGYAGWSLTVDNGGIDNLFDDDAASQDVQLSGSIAGWSVAVTSDESASTSSYKVSGNVGGVALTLTGTDVKSVGGDASKIAASYNMGNGLTLTASVQDEDDVDEDENKLGFSYAMDALTVSYTTIKPGGEVGKDSYGDEWDFSVKYTAGALVASFAIDEADETTIIADYALGGGASAFAAIHDKTGTSKDLTTVGLNFAF